MPNYLQTELKLVKISASVYMCVFSTSMTCPGWQLNWCKYIYIFKLNTMEDFTPPKMPRYVPTLYFWKITPLLLWIWFWNSYALFEIRYIINLSADCVTGAEMPVIWRLFQTMYLQPWCITTPTQSTLFTHCRQAISRWASGLDSMWHPSTRGFWSKKNYLIFDSV